MKHLLFVLLLGVGVTLAANRASDANNTTGTAGLIMIDKRGTLVRFFDPGTYKEISSLKIDGTPHELAISPDHKTAYVPNYGDGVYGNNPHPGHTIAVIDLATRRVRSTIDISPYIAPHGLQVDAHGTLYATCDLSRKLLVIDPEKLTVKAAIDTEGTGHWIAVLPDGSKAYVANKNDRPFISVIDLHANKMVGKVPMPQGTQGIAASLDGKSVLAMDLAAPKMVVINTKTDTIVDEVPITGNAKGAWRSKYSPDGKTVVVINVNERSASILNASALKSDQKKLTVGSQPFGIAFTADSSKALISNHGDGTISVIDLRRAEVVQSFAAGTGIETLSFF